MRVTFHWIVLIASLCALIVEAKYRFRFHTCRKEDQPILDRENLISLRQAAFIDDGSFGGAKYRKLSDIGFKIQHGSMFYNVNITIPKGTESTIHFMEISGTDDVIIINFWTRSYYFAKKGDQLNLMPHDRTMKPNFEHFIRVYFICAPGNARSALILFGDQAILRKKKRKNKDKPKAPKQKPSIPKSNTTMVPPKRRKRVPEEVKIGNSTVKKCRRRREKRQNQNVNPKRKYPMDRDITKVKRTAMDYKRLLRRAVIYRKVCLVFAHFGFGVGIIINCILLLVFFKLYKNSKFAPKKLESSDSDEKLLKGRGSGSDTVETKADGK